MVDPPGVLTTINNALCFWRMVRVIEISIRLPGSIALASYRSFPCLRENWIASTISLDTNTSRVRSIILLRF